MVTVCFKYNNRFRHWLLVLFIRVVFDYELQRSFCFLVFEEKIIFCYLSEKQAVVSTLKAWLQNISFWAEKRSLSLMYRQS